MLEMRLDISRIKLFDQIRFSFLGGHQRTLYKKSMC